MIDQRFRSHPKRKKKANDAARKIRTLLERNYLSGNIGDNMNTILAATGFNMMKMLKRLKNYGLENYFF
jgi:hypothetical protein